LVEINDGREGIGVFCDNVEYFIGADGAVAFAYFILFFMIENNV
jgi:hypothetical protein